MTAEYLEHLCPKCKSTFYHTFKYEMYCPECVAEYTTIKVDEYLASLKEVSKVLREAKKWGGPKHLDQGFASQILAEAHIALSKILRDMEESYFDEDEPGEDIISGSVYCPVGSSFCGPKGG